MQAHSVKYTIRALDHGDVLCNYTTQSSETQGRWMLLSRSSSFYLVILFEDKDKKKKKLLSIRKRQKESFSLCVNGFVKNPFDSFCLPKLSLVIQRNGILCDPNCSSLNHFHAAANRYLSV